MSYWLLKSEPATFSIDDLKNAPGGRDHWDGVRNYQARNHLRAMRKGDLGLFYHSNCPNPGIVGIIEIVREAYPDTTAFDTASPYYDPKSDPDQPRWFMVDVLYRRTFRRTLELSELRQHPELAEMPLLRRGNRLSVMPVTAQQWRFILTLK